MKLLEKGEMIEAKHSGLKKVFITHLSVKVQMNVDTGKSDWSSFLGDKYREFWTEPKNQKVEFFVSPAA